MVEGLHAREIVIFMNRISPVEQALICLMRVEQDGAFSSLLLSHHSRDSSLSHREEALLHELVKGVMRQRGKIDKLLGSVLTRKLESLPAAIRTLMRLATYQIVFLDDTPPEVAVSQAVNLTKKYGHAGTVRLVNAVLRKIVSGGIGEKELDLSDATIIEIAANVSHPEWLIERWLAVLGRAETIALCRSNNERWPTSVRANTLRTTPEELGQRLRQEGCEIQAGRVSALCFNIIRLPGKTRLTELSSFREGLFQVQDESSVLVGDLVCPKPGEFVVDLCSAPGGKTSHLAAQMKNEGQILAVDLYPQRLKLVEQTCTRLGITIVETLKADVRSLTLPRPADCILLDAPCSGTGVLGKKPDARWNKHRSDITRLATLQMELLNHAATLVKSGGRVVYSTCSLEHEENEDVVRAFVSAHPSFSVVDLKELLPETMTSSGFFTAWPHRHHMSGAFGAVLVRC